MASQAKTNSLPQYKQWRNRCLELRSVGGSSAFERATLLVQIFNDADFRIDNGNADDMKAADVLDDLIDDIGFSFWQVRKMLDRYPKQEQWQSGRLRAMYRDMIDADMKAKNAERAANTTARPRIKKADFEKVETEAKQKSAQVEILSEKSTKQISQIDTLQAENRLLKDENEKLKAENKRLQQRVRTLERSQLAGGLTKSL